MIEARNIAIAFLFVLGMMAVALETDIAIEDTHTVFSR
jgi:hypothetical protein